MRSIPKARMDALTDGIFAFAMTLLVLDVRLPVNAVYNTSQSLIDALVNLGPQLLAYIISFFVLALFWRGIASAKSETEPGQAHISAWLVYLFAMTFIPISTSIVGTYANLAPAVWVYAANMFFGALASWLMFVTWPGPVEAHHSAPTRIRLGLLMITAAVSVAVSFVDPLEAMWPYLINAAAPLIIGWRERRTVAARRS